MPEGVPLPPWAVVFGPPALVVLLAVREVLELHAAAVAPNTRSELTIVSRRLGLPGPDIAMDPTGMSPSSMFARRALCLTNR